MKHNYFILLFLTTFSFGFSQTTILCPRQQYGFKIENSTNIPTVTNNSDGTITLIHSQQYITDIFSKYIIYDFYQSSPSGSENAQKYYSIIFESKDLMVELIDIVPLDVFIFEDYFSGIKNFNHTLVNSDLVSFLDGKKFKVKEYDSTSDKSTQNKDDVTNDFNLTVEFNYDATHDMLYIENNELTPCGNSFSIALKGGSFDDTLQLWKSTPGKTTTSTFDQTCTNIESILYFILGVACNGGSDYGNFNFTIDNTSNSLLIERANYVFGYDTIIFEEDILSVTKNYFENIKLISSNNNQHLRFTNLKNSKYYIEVFSILGEKIIKKTLYQKNTISLNSFQNGLYIIKLSNSDNASKIFKYLN